MATSLQVQYNNGNETRSVTYSGVQTTFEDNPVTDAQIGAVIRFFDRLSSATVIKVTKTTKSPVDWSE